VGRLIPMASKYVFDKPKSNNFRYSEYAEKLGTRFLTSEAALD
jgi:hypothetical protein